MSRVIIFFSVIFAKPSRNHKVRTSCAILASTQTRPVYDTDFSATFPEVLVAISHWFINLFAAGRIQFLTKIYISCVEYTLYLWNPFCLPYSFINGKCIYDHRWNYGWGQLDIGPRKWPTYTLLNTFFKNIIM